MASETVLYEVRDGVAVITFNRPDRLNVWTAEMGTAYFDRLDEAVADSAVGAIVVTGAGRGFSAGADTELLRELSDSGAAPPPPDSRSRDHAYRLPKLTIGAINGAAVGMSLVHALYLDLRFAAAGAKLTAAFARRGLVAENGMSWLLPRLVGTANALDILLSSRVILAEEAVTLGLVNRVLPGPRPPLRDVGLCPGRGRQLLAGIDRRHEGAGARRRHRHPRRSQRPGPHPHGRLARRPGLHRGLTELRPEAPRRLCPPRQGDRLRGPARRLSSTYPAAGKPTAEECVPTNGSLRRPVRAGSRPATWAFVRRAVQVDIGEVQSDDAVVACDGLVGDAVEDPPRLPIRGVGPDPPSLVPLAAAGRRESRHGAQRPNPQRCYRPLLPVAFNRDGGRFRWNAQNARPDQMSDGGAGA